MRELMNLDLVFENDGTGDDYWSIEEDSDGVLYVTSNAETQRPITPQAHRGWDADDLRASLLADGVPAAIVERYIEQAGL